MAAESSPPQSDVTAVRAVSGIHQILVPLDLEPGSEQVFAHALKLALSTGAHLTAVHVRQDPNHPVDWTRATPALELLRSWGVLRADATEADLDALELHIERELRVARDAELGVISAVLERLPNLIVVGTHARTGWQRLREGSVAEAVARRSGAVTLFLPHGSQGFIEAATGRADIDTVLLPIGGDDRELQHAVDVLAAFLEILDVRRVRIITFHAGGSELPPLTLPVREGWTWDHDLRPGDIVDGILSSAQAHHPDLVVMATHGHDSLVDTLNGSRAEQVVRQVACPVLVVPIGPN